MASKNEKRKQNKLKHKTVTVPTTEGELSPQKRNELNRLVDQLLTGTTVKNWLGDGTAKPRDNLMQIEQLLQQCMAIESVIPSKVSERSAEDLVHLTDWLVDNGAKIDGVEVGEFEGYGCGLKAVKDLTDGDFLLSVPRKLMLTTDNACESELGHLISNDPLIAQMPNIWLPLFILLEKFRGLSFWEPYLNTLPSTYTTVLYFSPDEIEALKGSPIYEPSIKQRQNIARQYGYFYFLFNNSNDPASEILRNHFTYEHYRWAVSTMMTRQNFIPKSNAPQKGVILALIPYWDMGNHDNAKLTTDYNVELDQSEYYSCRDFPDGEQVFMSYGKRPNSELLLHNGFVHETNVSDGVKLRLGVSKSDPLVNLRSQVLNSLSIPSTAEFLLPANPRPFVPHGKFIAFLRVFNMDQETLVNLTEESSESLMDADAPHPIDTKVWQFLSNRIKLLLATYPTSLEEYDCANTVRAKMSPFFGLYAGTPPNSRRIYSNEELTTDLAQLLIEIVEEKEDEKLLTSGELTPCMKLSVLQRVTEKRIFINTLTDLKTYLEICQREK